MNVIRMFSEEIAAAGSGGIQRLAYAVGQEFDALVGRIRAGWGIQHGPEGEHTDITSNSAATGLLSAGCLNLQPTSFRIQNASGADVEIQGVPNWPHVTYLRLKLAATGQIIGIDPVGRRAGDVLLLMADQPSGGASNQFLLIPNSPSTQPNWRLSWDTIEHGADIIMKWHDIRVLVHDVDGTGVGRWLVAR